MGPFEFGRLGHGKPDGDSAGGMNIAGFPAPPGRIESDPLSGESYSPGQSEQAGEEESIPGKPTQTQPKQISAEEEFYTIVDLLSESKRRGASDLHLTVGAPPTLRIDGELVPLNYPKASSDEIKGVIYSMMSEMQIKEFEIEREFDFAYSLKNFGRFRVNVFLQRGSLATAIRTVPSEMLSIDKLGLPPITKDLALRPRGIIFVTGPTGSGKTTSLAAMIDYINENRTAHILTVEDPIEFLHKHKQCLVNQRELGSDTNSFPGALRHVLRQDPDVILVGELRDLESMQVAITAAETGHLVLTTLHTNDASQTIDRIIDVFPPSQQAQIRLQLANSLQAIFCQTLCKKKGGGRIMAYELLIANNAVRNLIREGKIHQIPTAIETGVSQGMQTMTTSLIELVENQLVDREEARSHASNPSEFDAQSNL